jgi:hypothetical protein
MSRIVAWTGHRPDLFLDPTAAREALIVAARDLTEAGAERFLVGGQRGVDTWAALAAIECGVPFTLVLPFPAVELTREWLEADRSVLLRTLELANEVRVAGGYSQRNRQLATGASLLVAVWTGTAGGGTAETITLARQAGTPIHEILLEASPEARSASGPGI